MFVLWALKLHILHSENVPFLVANAVSLLFIPSILLSLPMQDMTLMVAKGSPVSFPSLLIKLNFNELFLSAQGVFILDFTFFFFLTGQFKWILSGNRLCDVRMDCKTRNWISLVSNIFGSGKTWFLSLNSSFNLTIGLWMVGT